MCGLRESGACMREPRSISTPITLTAVAASLSIALLVAWTIILVGGDAPTWLLVLGIIAFVVVMLVLVLFGVSLAREILVTRQQNQFIDSVTHELKSPLASLKLSLSTLERPELSGVQRAEVQRAMNDDVDRLAVFIDDVLEASRIASRRGLATPTERIVLNDLIERAVDRVLQRRGGSREEVSIDIRPTELAVYSDPTALEAILKNLIDNAVKYSDRPSRVTVGAFHEGSELVIEVGDEGIGIPQADLKRIFSRFYRVDSEAVRRRKGTGLGLFVVDAMARRLGGRLSAHSEGPGQGTLMKLRLPGDKAE